MVAFEQVGKRIRQERNKLKITQEKLAEFAGLTESYIGQIERGNKNPSLESLINISNVLGVTVDYLLQDVSVVKSNSLLDELNNLARSRTKEQIRLLLNVNKLIVDYLDNDK